MKDTILISGYSGDGDKNKHKQNAFLRVSSSECVLVAEHSILRNFAEPVRALNFEEFNFDRFSSRIQFSEIHFWSTLISHSIFRNSLLVDSDLAFNFEKSTVCRPLSRMKYTFVIKTFLTKNNHWGIGYIEPKSQQIL